MRILALIFMLGCSLNRTKMVGVIDSDEMYFDGWVPVSVENAPNNARTWVRLNRKQLLTATKGTRVVFYVNAQKVGATNESR